MRKPAGAKKRSIISYENLSDELKELFKEEYSDGYKEYLQKIVKPSGEPIFVVPLETEDTSYMVKFEVTIDSKVSEDDIDKDLDLPKDDNDVSLDDIDEEKDDSHKEFSLNHGDYEEDEKLDKDESDDGIEEDEE